MALDNILSITGKDIPIMFPDKDPEHPLQMAPVKYYGPVNIVENDETGVKDTNTIFMLSDVGNPFPNRSYRKNAK